VARRGCATGAQGGGEERGSQGGGEEGKGQRGQGRGGGRGGQGRQHRGRGGGRGGIKHKGGKRERRGQRRELREHRENKDRESRVQAQCYWKRRERDGAHVAALNRALPPDIRVLGWSPAEGLSARLRLRLRGVPILLAY